MTLRILHEDDVSVIFAIEQLAQIAPWTIETFHHCLRAGCVGWVSTIDNQVIGFILLSLQHGEGHILNLCVHPDFQHSGYGRELIQYALTIAKEKRIGMIFLEVRRSNLHAITLYKTLDFVQIGERKNYYPTLEGREDALVFAKDLGVE